MKKTFTTILAALAALVVYGQLPVATVLESVGDDNSLTLTAKTSGYGTFTIRLNVADVTNCDTDAAALSKTYLVRGNSTSPLAVLTPADPSQPVGIRYGWDWVQGVVDAAPDRAYAYALPLCTKCVTVRELTAHDVKMERASVADFKMWEMSTKNSVEAVRAMREGVVTEAGNGSITVEHTDGTQAFYGGLEEIYLHAGDEVWAEDIIGRCNGSVTVGIYRYASDPGQVLNPQSLARREYQDALFHTKKGNVRLIDGKTYRQHIGCSYMRQVKRFRRAVIAETKNQ